jgi:radical SAM-linked protein
LLNELLSSVSKPVRYLGREVNSAVKDPSAVRLRFCLAFPDVYEVGMSHLGIQILYHILNSRKDISCERVFAPWIDLEHLLRNKGVPLSSLETFTPLTEFDILGFSLQYELSYTNVLNMLSLAGIPLLASERDERFPLIVAGGPAAFNPVPVADFFDAVLIGDGEEAIVEICDLTRRWKESGGGKEELLKALCEVEGVYVPCLHTGGPIRKRLLSDLDRAPFPVCPVLPYMKVVHDRLSMEIARGCKRGCRFCQAGFVYRPYRERSPQVIEEMLQVSLKNTGYEEISLLSLSAGDYSVIGPLLTRVMDQFESKRIAVSLPSLRIEEVVGHLAAQVSRVRKTGFTIAPEAGTERLRKVINKQIDEEVFFRSASDLFSKGWRNLKLYFMMGLPSETGEDLQGILDLSKKILDLGRRQKGSLGVAVSVSNFVPKPHTPFQWEPQISLEEMKEKLRFLKEGFRKSPCRLKWQDPHLSRLEGIFSNGDRSLSRVLVEAHRLGCRFDGWSDQFRYDLWEKAFERTGTDMAVCARRKDVHDVLPWSFVSTGVDPRFLREEYETGLRGEYSPPCRKETCRRCGLCDGKGIGVREAKRDEISLSKPSSEAALQSKEMKKRVRLRFEKRGPICFVSHLELAHLFHRAAKRARLALSYSEGFHPMPKIIFETALPVGMESMEESVDLEIEDGMKPAEIMDRLNQTLPAGIRITGAGEASVSRFPSAPLRHSTYWIELNHSISRTEADIRIKNALEKKELQLTQERKEKKRSIDLRPLIERMVLKKHPDGDLSCRTGFAENGIEKGDTGWGIELVLRRNGRTAKPSEVIGAILGLDGPSLSRIKVVKLE